MSDALQLEFLKKANAQLSKERADYWEQTLSLQRQLNELGRKLDVTKRKLEMSKSALESAVSTIDYWEDFRDLSKMTVDLDRVRQINTELQNDT